MENHNFNGKIHYKWPFSIATLNYQRVGEVFGDCPTRQAPGSPWVYGVRWRTAPSWRMVTLVCLKMGNRSSATNFYWETMGNSNKPMSPFSIFIGNRSVPTTTFYWKTMGHLFAATPHHWWSVPGVAGRSYFSWVRTRQQRESTRKSQT